MLDLFPRLTDDVNLQLFDDVFDVPMFHHDLLMKTDVKEEDGKYVMKMDLPGCKKEDIQVSLHDGNLNVHVSSSLNKEEKDAKGQMIHQERFSGTCERTFYVGKEVREDEIHACFNDGTLTIEVPSHHDHPEMDQKRYIEIE